MNWLLEFADEKQPGLTYPLSGSGPVIVGRGEQCAVRLKSAMASRRHCQLTLANEGWLIEDLGSNNGTFVNDQRVERAVLREGDMISAGGVRLRLSRDGEATQEYVAARDELDLGGEKVPVDVPATQKVIVGKRYELRQILHQGATGTFYRALDTKRGKPVCVKVLASRLAADEDQLKRFIRGVRSAGELRHPNIVHLHQAGRSGTQWWLAMELVNGPSLRKLAAEVGIGNMLPPQRVYKIACDIAQALCAAAERGLLHRNIKPDSILLTAKGTAKLSNFTLARGVVLERLDQITRSGELVGDLAYMAPERAEPDGAPDGRSDIYSLGACLYHVLTGKPPFTGRGTVHLLQCIRGEAPKPPSKLNLSVPATLESLVLKCLAKSPSDRHNSPQELATELARIGRFQGLSG